MIARSSVQGYANKETTPQEIGRVAAFLVSDDASYMTGSLMYVDAGMTAQLETWSD